MVSQSCSKILHKGQKPKTEKIGWIIKHIFQAKCVWFTEMERAIQTENATASLESSYQSAYSYATLTISLGESIKRIEPYI